MRNNFDPIKYFDDGSVWGSVGSGALSGAAAGSVIGPWGTVVGGVIGAGAGLIEGENQKKKANSLLAANQYRQMGIPREELENQQIARNQALQGLPSQQYQQAMQNIQRQQQMALRGAQDRRAGIGLVGSVQQGADDAQGRLDAANANARLQNQRQLMSVNNQVAAYRGQDWRQNEANRSRNYDYGMQLLGAGNANIMGGIDTGLATLTSAYGNGLFGGEARRGAASSTPGLSSINSQIAP